MNALIDCHTHSLHSFDGEAPVEELCRQAVRRGLSVYGLTDHCDLTKNTGEELFFEIQSSVREVEAFRESCREPVIFLTGIELGQAVDNYPAAEKAAALCDYDFVIGSIHNAGGIEDFYFEDYSKMSMGQIDELMQDYFDRLILLIDWGKADTLAHITYPFRYMAGEYGLDISAERYRSFFDEILIKMIQSDMALEVNTSGLRQKLGKTLPDGALLSRYRELGGKLITLGSDAHKTEDVGAGIPQALLLLRQIGFDAVYYYKNRHPVKIGL